MSLGIIFAIIVIVIGIVAFTNRYVMDSGKYSRRRGNQAPTNKPTMHYGCEYPGWCQYANLGDPAMQGHNTDTHCYCMKKKTVVERVANCTDFLSPGCNNDICMYATQDHQNHTVYCSCFNVICVPQESCQYFEKKWETINMMRQLAQRLQDSNKN